MKSRKNIWFVSVVLGVGTAFLLIRNRSHEPSPETVEMIPPPIAERMPPSVTNVVSASVDISSPRIRAVLNTTSFWSRLSAVHNLPKDLSTNETGRLGELLLVPADSGTPRGNTVAFKNDLIVALRDQELPPPQLPDVLITIFRNRQADIALRDYALQHLGAWYEEILLVQGDSPDSVQRKKIITTVLTEALEETSTSIAGTAVLSLHRLASADKGVDLAFVSDAAGKLVNNPATGELTKITAVQVCAENGNKAPLTTIMELAKSGAGVPLRLSAIAAVGFLGESKDRAFLQSLLVTPDIRVRAAAKAALSRFDSRAQPQTATPSI